MRNVTALMIACAKGNVEAINVLVNAGADSTITDIEGVSWIHFAVFGDCSKEALQAIIDHGADVNATDKNNVTALMTACQRGHVEAINILLKVGADPGSESDILGATCICYAQSVKLPSS